MFLLKHAYLVLTDSDGIQEEAPSLGKPVLVRRGVTALLSDETAYTTMSKAHNPYGNGTAVEKIIAVFL